MLVGGLALIAAIVANADEVDLHALHLIHADGVSTHDVAKVYVAGWLSPDFNPFVDGRLRVVTPILTALQLASVAAIGRGLLDVVPGVGTWPRLVRILGSFLPGFLMVLLPLRLLFSALPVVQASHVALVLLPIVAFLVQRGRIIDGARRLRAGEDAALPWAVAAAGGIVVLCALDRLQAGRYFMVPDSITDFLKVAGAQLQGQAGKYLVQWDQQSDEWVFNAPLLFSSHGARDQLFVFWMTQATGIASFGALVFGLVWRFAWRRRTLAAVLATGAVLASTPAIFPWDNVSLFGGQNPALWLGHPGRLVSIVAPFFALLLLGPWTRRQAVAVLLATAGLAFVTANGMIYTVGAVVCAMVWTVLIGRVPRAAGAARTIAVHVFALAALAAPVYVYWAEGRSDYLDDGVGWLLVVGGALAVVASIVLALTTRPVSAAPIAWRSAGARAVAAAGALITGLFLSNNMVSDFAGGAVRNALGHVLPGYSGPVVSRQVLAKHFEFPSFTGDECQISGHCLSGSWFLAVYGLTIVLALASWMALGRLGETERVDRRRAVWLVIVAALVMSFAVVDFTGADSLSAWNLTRLIEVPYYAILAFAAVALVGSRSRFTVITGGTVLAVWTVVPFVHSHILEQLVKNADWLVARAGG